MEKALLNGQMENATKEIINKIKNKVEVCSILEMVGNMQVLGLMENNLVLEYITRVKNNIELECGKMGRE